MKAKLVFVGPHRLHSVVYDSVDAGERLQIKQGKDDTMRFDGRDYWIHAPKLMR